MKHLAGSILLLVVCFGCNSSQSSSSSSTADGTESLASIDVAEASLAMFEEELRKQTDKVVVVDVWASW